MFVYDIGSIDQSLLMAFSIFDDNLKFQIYSTYLLVSCDSRIFVSHSFCIFPSCKENRFCDVSNQIGSNFMDADGKWGTDPTDLGQVQQEVGEGFESY